MSASLVVDLGQTCQMVPSVATPVNIDGTPASGVIIGNVVDTIYANTLTNIVVTGGASLSGIFKVQVQAASGTASGLFSDPTSGLAVMPTNFLSGGILICNSGRASGGVFQSGVCMAGGFLTPFRYVRANIMSGDLFNAPVNVSVVKQLKQTGSGGGFTQQPQGNTTVSV